MKNHKGSYMDVILDTRVFLFDASRDYLPSYNRHIVKMDESLKVKDVLLEIESLENFFTFKKTNTMLQINGVSIKGSLAIKTAVTLFGREWTMEPISTFRAKKDLTIDDSDFYAKHVILEAFADEEDEKYYTSLIREYYASGTLAYNQEYFGDSMFLYAHHLIEKYPEKKEAILSAINVPNGIGSYEDECNLYPYNDNAQIIYALESEITVTRGIEGFSDKKMAYYDSAEETLVKHFDTKRDGDCALETIIENIGIERVVSALKNPFSAFKVAFYVGSFTCQDMAEVEIEAKKLLEAIGAEVVEFTSARVGDGFDIVADDSAVAYKKAGRIVFDAFDSGAEILVVDSKESHFMIDQSKKAVERAIGRDIRIPVLSIAQVVAMAIGITDRAKLGIDAHKIDVALI